MMRKQNSKPTEEITDEITQLPAKIALIGRPNVGKSTLFNRLIGRRQSIVQRESGTTRDRVSAVISWTGRKLKLIDTGGMLLGKQDAMQSAIEVQVKDALEEADLLIWVCDITEGVVPLEEKISAFLRKEDKPIILVANKADDPQLFTGTADFYRLGHTNVIPISAMHGYGTGDLLDMAVDLVPEVEPDDSKVSQVSIAIIGEPNAGKSTYLNQLLGRQRTIVSDVPGTTRDAIEEQFEWQGREITLVDTAGYRQKRKIKDAAMFFSMSRTKQAIQAADVVLILFDAETGFTKVTKQMFQFTEQEGKCCVLVANKWDLVEKDPPLYEKELKEFFGFLKHIPMQSISAKNGDNIVGPMSRAVTLWQKSMRKLGTHELNKFLKAMKQRNPPPPTVTFKYITMTGYAPVRFTIYGKGFRRLDTNYRLYIENQLIEKFRLFGLPIRLRFKEEERAKAPK